MRIRWVLCVAALGLCWAQVPKKNPFAGDPGAAPTGRVMFRGACAPCHGIRAEGGKGPDLTLGTYSVGENDTDLFNVIFNGAGGTEMPEFGSRLDADDIWRLVSYIRSVARRETVTLKGNQESGEKLFWSKGQCGQCHRIRDRGGRMGPDLTAVGRMRSLAYLKESLLDPGADITTGYPTVTVVTKDGKKVVGTQRGYDNFSAQLMDTSDKFYSFLRGDVTSMKREFKSLMPAYRGTFGDAELDDLLAYLVSLRGEGKR